LKDIVYAGFLKAQELNKDENLGILVDEVYGSHILKDAKKEILFLLCQLRSQVNRCLNSNMVKISKTFNYL